MTKEKRMELGELVEGASKGPWRSPWKPGSEQLCAGVEAVGSHYIVLHVDRDKDYHPDTVERWKRDCTYIAYVSPDLVIGLLDQLEAAEGLLGRCADVAKTAISPHANMTQIIQAEKSAKAVRDFIEVPLRGLI